MCLYFRLGRIIDMKKHFLITLLILCVTGCVPGMVRGDSSNNGFWIPFTARMEVPDGPPEFQAGWHDGCSSGYRFSPHGNARFYDLNLGSGIYQHDPIYKMAYGKALFSCASQPGYFIGHPSYNGPLEHGGD